MPRISLAAGLAVAGLFALDTECEPAFAATGDDVTVAGNHLVRDGAVWIPHGVVLTAFEAGPTARSTETVFRNAFDDYTPAEFARIKAWGADSVRIQVAQPAVDPLDPEFDATFLLTVESAVRAARAAGLAVIVSIQDEPQSGEQPNLIARLPNLATLRVWLELAPVFNIDRGILYEILNEPQLQRVAHVDTDPAAPDAADWAAWKASMETVIGAIRLTGSRNVVVADGLDLAETLDGAPLIEDARHQVAYAVHPYFDAGLANDAAGWTRRFGSFARTAPVIATEWNTPATLPCDGQTPSQAVGFLRYLQSAGIGLDGYGYDFVAPSFGAIVTAFDPLTPNPPTTYVGQSCFTNPDGVTSTLTPDFGPGRIIQDWYRTGTVPASPE